MRLSFHSVGPIAEHQLERGILLTHKRPILGQVSEKRDSPTVLERNEPTITELYIIFTAPGTPVIMYIYSYLNLAY